MPSTSGVASMDKWSNCFPGLEGQFLQIRAYPVIFFGVVKGGGEDGCLTRLILITALTPAFRGVVCAWTVVTVNTG